MRADARANRDALIAAARHLTAAQGAAVALSTIADEAGVGIATLYRHFPTREDLLLAIVRDLRDRVDGIVEEFVQADTSDPQAWWESFVRTLAALRPGALVSELAETLSDEATLAECTRLRDEALACLDSALTVAKRIGVARPDLTATRFQLGLATITRPLAVPVDVPELAETQEWLIGVYMRGLRP